MATFSDRNTSIYGGSYAQTSKVMASGGFYPQNSRIFDNASIPQETIDKINKHFTKHDMMTAAVKFDEGKVDWTLVPFEALEGMAQVLEFGAKKYDRWNWTTGGGFKWTRVLASCLRHLFAFMRGEDNDPESGLSHISHAQCNLLFLAYYIRNKKTMNKDDRNVR